VAVLKLGLLLADPVKLELETDVRVLESKVEQLVSRQAAFASGISAIDPTAAVLIRQALSKNLGRRFKAMGPGIVQVLGQTLAQGSPKASHLLEP